MNEKYLVIKKQFALVKNEIGMHSRTTESALLVAIEDSFNDAESFVNNEIETIKKQCEEDKECNFEIQREDFERYYNIRVRFEFKNNLFIYNYQIVKFTGEPLSLWNHYGTGKDIL